VEKRALGLDEKANPPEILYHSIISKSKYEQAVQGLFTTGTSFRLS
jgi:hypothetical protein